MLDDIEEDKQIRKERRENREQKEKESNDYVKMLRDQKQELIDKAHDREVERNISLGLPVIIKTEE